MAGYTPASLETKGDILRRFEEAVRKQLHFVDKDRIYWHSLPATMPSQSYTIYKYDEAAPAVELEEYSDYVEIPQDGSLQAAADKLGFAAGVLYNALLGKAMRKHGFGLHVLDLFDNNLRMIITPAGPSVVDPTGRIGSYAAFRFRFGAASGVK